MYNDFGKDFSIVYLLHCCYLILRKYMNRNVIINIVQQIFKVFKGTLQYSCIICNVSIIYKFNLSSMLHARRKNS